MGGDVYTSGGRWRLVANPSPHLIPSTIGAEGFPNTIATPGFRSLVRANHLHFARRRRIELAALPDRSSLPSFVARFLFIHSFRDHDDAPALLYV